MSETHVLQPDRPDRQTTELDLLRKRWRPIALLVAGALFMENLDGTVIATAIPQMALSFRVAPADLNIGLSAYLLTLAVFIPISGWVADRFGARTVFAVAIVTFTLSSVLCGISSGLFEFALMRVLQGVGGAMMVPVGRLIVLRNTAKSDLISAIAYITWPALAAPVLGPPLGGFVTTYASWRWIFFLNAPLGLFAVSLAFALIPNTRSADRRSFDFIGFIASGGACLALMYSLELIARAQAPWAEIAAGFLASLGMGFFAVRHFRRVASPLIDLSSLRVHTYTVALKSGSLFRMTMSATPFVLPLMFQVGFGMDAFESGLLVLAMFAGNLFMKPATTPVLRRYEFRSTLIANGLITVALFIAFVFIDPTMPKWMIVILLFASGLSRSMQFTCLNTLAFADVPQRQMSGANTLASTAQQLSMGLGIAMGAIALKVGGRLAAVGHLSDIPAVSYRLAFGLIALVSLAAVVECFRLAPTAGRHLRTKQ
jgi:EmrB/QacA subfamily drug resistance transporter